MTGSRMNMNSTCCGLLLFLWLLAPLLAAEEFEELQQPEENVRPLPSEVQELGEGRLQVGAIIIDTKAGSFAVEGRVLSHELMDTAMEFIATTAGGMKSYESVLELDTTALDFNLACILIGLDESKAKRSRYHFDPEPVTGDEVAITVAFEKDGAARTLPVHRLLKGFGADVAHQWIYTGSGFTPDGTYLAESVGTLIGFVHDPESILQHGAGVGLGDYGAVTLDADVLPAGETPVTVTVKRVGP